MNQNTHIDWQSNYITWIAVIPGLLFFVFSTYYCLNILINEFDTINKFKLMAITSAITLHMVMIFLMGSGLLYLRIHKAVKKRTMESYKV